MKKVATYRPPEPCKDCGGLHFGSARCPYLERTGPCEICDTDTVYACSDCAIDFKGRVVRVCTNPNCRDRHEEKTHASTIRGSRMNTQPLAEYVHHLTDCPTREIGRGDEGCTCGAPKIIADIELAYGLLWCVLGTDERTHRARMLLAKAIGPDGMKRGLLAVPTWDRPSDKQMIDLFLQGDGP